MNTVNLKQHLMDFSPLYLTQALFNISFYGIRSIFVLYAINRFSLNDSQAISLFATFMILCYGTSLIGGYIADKGLGVKNAVIIGGIFSTLGFLSILSPFRDLCFLGLSLASLGSGFTKPNLFTAAGLLFEDPKDPKKDRVFSLLYMAMNFGGLIASIISGFVGQTYGWHYGILLLATICMGATYFVYKTMRFHPSYQEKLTLSKWKLLGVNLFLIVFLYFLFKYQHYFHSLMGIITGGSIVCLGKIYYQCSLEERKDILTIIAYIFLFALFCTLYEQAGTSLMLFFEKLVDREVMGIVVPSSAFLSLDPLFVLICGPILLFISSKYLEKSKPMNGVTKIGYGFLFVAASFGILALSTFYIKDDAVPFIWVIGAMFAQTVGELWIAPVSFSKISQYAPLRHKSILMSFWPMTIAYGHYFAGFVAQFSLCSPTLQPSDSFIEVERYHAFFSYLFITPLCVGLSLLCYRWIKKYNENGL